MPSREALQEQAPWLAGREARVGQPDSQAPFYTDDEDAGVRGSDWSAPLLEPGFQSTGSMVLSIVYE